MKNKILKIGTQIFIRRNILKLTLFPKLTKSKAHYAFVKYGHRNYYGYEQFHYCYKIYFIRYMFMLLTLEKKKYFPDYAVRYIAQMFILKQLIYV